MGTSETLLLAIHDVCPAGLCIIILAFLPSSKLGGLHYCNYIPVSI